MANVKDLKAVSSSLNILYAEDELMLRESMENTFTKLFANTFVAKNGQEALYIYKKEKIDIVFTDINMPIMSGIELIQGIKNCSDKEEPIIIVLSAHNESKLLSTLINLGIGNFLNKPVDKQLMVDSLYKSCQILNDKKLILEYEVKLQSELEIIHRKNIILEKKLKQLANQTNKNIDEKVFIETKYSNDTYFENLLQDDKDELRDLSTDMDNYIAMLFQEESINEEYIDKVSSTYVKYASVISSYPEFFEIANALKHFAKTIVTTVNKFTQDLNQTGIYFESMQLTLESYRVNTWNKEAANPRFYNASLLVDIQGIIDFLEEKEHEDGEMEFF